MKKLLTILLGNALLMGCLGMTAFAESTVVETPFVSQTEWENCDGGWLKLSGSYGKYTAPDAEGTVSVEVGETITDQGGLTYSVYSYALSSRAFVNNPTTYPSTNPVAIVDNENVVSVDVYNTYYSGARDPIMLVSFTGLSNGTTKVTIPYSTEAMIEYDYFDEGAGNTAITYGEVVYTVTVSGGTAPELGDGEDGDYEGWTAISNATQLRQIDQDMSGHYYLTNDIEIDEYRSGYNGGWDPIGNFGTAFTGVFDGCGNTISGFDSEFDIYNEDGSTGLFACNDGTIRDLNVEVSSVMSVANAGALCGTNNGLIEDVHVSGTSVSIVTWDSGSENAGGLVGVNNGTIQRCSAEDLVVASKSVAGGLVGKNTGGIYDSFSTCGVNSEATSVTGYWTAGGLVGKSTGGTISGCYVYAKAPITAAFEIGGFIGSVEDTDISNGYLAHNDLIYGDYGHISFPIGSGSAASAENTYIAPSSQDNSYDFIPVYPVSQLCSTDLMTVTERSDGRTAYLYKEESGYDYPVLYWQVEGWEDDEAPGESVESYTVSFDSDTITKGGDMVAIDEKTVEDGDSITLPEASRDDTGTWAYKFTGWRNGDTIYAAGEEYPVTADVTLTATWSLYSISGDKVWDVTDAMIIMESYKGVAILTDEQMAIGDYNNDGRTCDVVDAMVIMEEYKAATPV